MILIQTYSYASDYGIKCIRCVYGTLLIDKQPHRLDTHHFEDSCASDFTRPEYWKPLKPQH